MDKNKLAQYRLTASIHTAGIKSKTKPLIPATVSLDIVRSGYMQKTDMWTLRINPNKLAGDLFTYSEFCAAMHEICYKMKIENPIYYRTDIRLDSYNDDFQKYYKLNLLLINLFSILFNDSNGQAVAHLLTCSKAFTDISTKNQYWEVKYYDKKFQTHDSDPAKARLEFRSLKSTNADGYAPHEIKEKWFEKLDRLPALYDNLQERCNKALHKAYREYCEYNKNGNSKRDNLTAFLSNYSYSMTIFTRKQLRAFLMECGVSESAAEERAKYIIDKVHIEFFSQEDIKRYIAKIKNSMEDFFTC